jgi:hypothetical protein
MVYFRFPRTPHLAWLAPGEPRRDKVLSPLEAQVLLSHQVIVEEKVDGANLGFSIDEAGDLRAQNRGAFLLPENSHPQFKPLFRWMAQRRSALVKALAPDLMLFGEWCYAVHAVQYTALPDWFLAFDVYDRADGQFWSAARRDDLVRQIGVSQVPEIAAGRFDFTALKSLLGPSKLTTGPVEGIYVRYDSGDHLVARAKLVRPEFVQGISTHWSRQQIRTNSLESATAAPSERRSRRRTADP